MGWWSIGRRDFYKVNENELHHNLQSSVWWCMHKFKTCSCWTKISCSIAQGSSLVSSQRPAPSFNREHMYRAPGSKAEDNKSIFNFWLGRTFFCWTLFICSNYFINKWWFSSGSPGLKLSVHVPAKTFINILLHLDDDLRFNTCIRGKDGWRGEWWLFLLTWIWVKSNSSTYRTNSYSCF